MFVKGNNLNKKADPNDETGEYKQKKQFDWDSPSGPSPWHIDHPDNIGEENRIENITLSDAMVSNFTDNKKTEALLETDKENKSCGPHTPAVERQGKAQAANPTVSQPVAKNVDNERPPEINKNYGSVESRQMKPVPQQPSGRKLFIGFSELTAAQKARQEEKQIWGRTKSGRTFLLSASQKAERSAAMSAAKNDGSVASRQMENNLVKKEVLRDQSALSYRSSENKTKAVEDSPNHVGSSLRTSTTDNTKTSSKHYEKPQQPPVPQQPSGRKLFIGFSELTAVQKAKQEEKQIWGRTKSGRTYLLSESQKAQRSAATFKDQKK